MKFFLLITLLALTSCLSKVERTESQHLSSKPSEGLELSEQEKIEVQEFLEKMQLSNSCDMNGIYKEAEGGDRVAMWILGHQYLTGKMGVINQDAANLLFQMSGSLGYAPALYEISQMYANQHKDPLLSFVYLNLAISSGHNEYRDFYYQRMQMLSQLAGGKIVQELEKIALEKAIRIRMIQNELQDQPDSKSSMQELIFKNITSDDSIYTEHYWEQFFSSHKAWEQFFYPSLELDSK